MGSISVVAAGDENTYKVFYSRCTDGQYGVDIILKSYLTRSSY